MNQKNGFDVTIYAIENRTWKCKLIRIGASVKENEDAMSCKNACLRELFKQMDSDLRSELQAKIK